MSRQPGSKPTLAKVAERAGVSVSTASLAFSGSGPITPKTRDKVLAAAKELDYSGPNPLGRQLRQGRSGIVGVVIGDQLGRSFRDPVAVQVMHGLVSAIGEQGMGVLLIPGTPQGAKAPAVGGLGDAPESKVAVDPLVETAAMDVAVLVWGAYADDPNIAAFQRRGVPIVIGEGRKFEDVPVVAIDDRAGTAESVRHLVDLGHTRIAEIAMPFGRDERSGPVDAERLTQVDKTPTRNRLAGVRDVIEPVMSWETPASLMEHGRDAATEILGDWAPANDRPTAIVAHSDLLAAGAVIAARELGLRVPEDVSVVGFDGLDLPWLSPDILSSVSQPLEEKGWALGTAVAAVLAGEQVDDIVLPTAFHEGTTTGPVPQR